MRQAVVVAGGLALAIGLVGCGTTDTVSGLAQSTPSASAPAATTSAPSSGSGSGSSSAGGAKTAAAAMTSFVTQVLQQHYAKACKDNAPGAAPGQAPATVCAKPEMTKTLTSLHDAWAKPGVQLPPVGKVKVSALSPQGDSVTVPDTAVTLDGHTLHDLELIGSSGDTSSFKMSFVVTKVNGSWYVSNFNIDV